MTLKASWFNFGIYKNALRRFKWGSVLYFVILFFAVPFMFLVGNYSYPEYYNRFGIKPNMLIENGFMVVPILTAYGVSVVVAVILYRYIHENKQSITIHSLPVTRRANYISTLFAGFTLMLAPVVINGIILLVMSLTGWGDLFTPVYVIYWIGDNIEVLFIMFSISTFAAFLTGQWAAHVGITILIHLLPIFAALGVGFFSEVFLYGYTYSGTSLPQMIIQNTPFVWLFPGGKILMGTEWIHLHINDIVYKIMAVTLYIATYFVYKIRRVEACGDVAAFKIVRHVLKYGITAMVMLVVSAVAYEARLELVTIIILNLVFGIIAYCATEMVLSKSLKVSHKYKGFIGLCVVVACIVSFFAFTNVFGYETRIPSADKIEAATIRVDNSKPFVSDEESIAAVIKNHKYIISDIPVVDKRKYYEEVFGNRYRDTRDLYVEYKLTNGNTFERMYRLSGADCDAILSEMFKNETYKQKILDLYYVNYDNVTGIDFDANISHKGKVYTYHFAKSDALKILEAMKADIKNLTYEDIAYDAAGPVEFEFKLRVRNDDELNELIDGILLPEAIEEMNYIPDALVFNINSKYTKTMEILKESGHYDGALNLIAENLYICKEPIYTHTTESIESVAFADSEYYSNITEITYKGETGYASQFKVAISDCVRVDATDAKRFAEELLDGNMYNETVEAYHGVYYSDPGSETVRLNTSIAKINKNTAPDYLKKYVE